ncbi:hypothetical protein ERJ71_14965 [Paenibacillus polymyxa]|uniref:Uncharacterized protein n=1 Tax=Paenibacillus polymyxa TaxID=1406 RepID=A0A378Y0A0_PAEPO|nr:hypothetical protein [Paenibacillus polymyxa]QPK51258.1 hypothetical protein G7035_20340 [Paenibacillus polymyxa]WEK65613.1 hypothetical protein ERJ71_14965 [Paenibacillus polymyxa]SUA70258.1 Uncharacterised protein [Paenibacillus polymyxa]
MKLEKFCWIGSDKVLPFNFERLSELYNYLEIEDIDYGELQELRDKIYDLKQIVEDKMDVY